MKKLFKIICIVTYIDFPWVCISSGFVLIGNKLFFSIRRFKKQVIYNTIFNYDFVKTRKMRNSKKKTLTRRQLLFNLLQTCFVGILTLVVAIWFMSTLMKINPYHEYLLMTEGISTKGFITKTDLEIDENERGGITKYHHYYGYKFTTKEGKSIESSGRGNGQLSEEFVDLHEPYPISILYLKNNPELNEIKDNLSDSMFEFILRKIILGLLLLSLFCSIGIIVIIGAIKDYLKGINEHNQIELRDHSYLS